MRFDTLDTKKLQQLEFLVKLILFLCSPNGVAWWPDELDDVLMAKAFNAGLVDAGDGVSYEGTRKKNDVREADDGKITALTVRFYLKNTSL